MKLEVSHCGLCIYLNKRMLITLRTSCTYCCDFLLKGLKTFQTAHAIINCCCDTDLAASASAFF